MQETLKETSSNYEIRAYVAHIEQTLQKIFKGRLCPKNVRKTYKE